MSVNLTDFRPVDVTANMKVIIVAISVNLTDFRPVDVTADMNVIIVVISD